MRQKKPDNAIVVKANWRDNPWFPAVLEEERRLDLQLYPERYAHIWEGDYAKAKELLDRLGVVRPEVQKVLDRLTGIPIDIEPRFVTAAEVTR